MRKVYVVKVRFPQIKLHTYNKEKILSSTNSILDNFFLRVLSYGRGLIKKIVLPTQFDLSIKLFQIISVHEKSVLKSKPIITVFGLNLIFNFFNVIYKNIYCKNIKT